MAQLTIWLHRDAPAKPPVGDACNGCGVCCSAEPCPLGMLLSLRVRGRCRMLHFEPAQSRYRCGLMEDPSDMRAPVFAFGAAGPLMPALSHAGPRRLLRRLVARWIGAGRGCDSSAQAIAAAPTAGEPH
jgi:hypothetical protein